MPIEGHEALSPMRNLIPRIEAFIAAMDRHKEELNNTRLVLAHRDLNFGNIMYDVSRKRITAVLDWEFGAFMWSGVDNEEKIGLWEGVERRCREKGIRFFEDVEYRGKRQEHIQLAMNHFRAIVEVMPRGQADRPVETWREEILKHMDTHVKIRLNGKRPSGLS